jgi:hypothetical protein
MAAENNQFSPQAPATRWRRDVISQKRNLQPLKLCGSSLLYALTGCRTRSVQCRTRGQGGIRPWRAHPSCLLCLSARWLFQFVACEVDKLMSRKVEGWFVVYSARFARYMHASMTSDLLVGAFPGTPDTIREGAAMGVLLNEKQDLARTLGSGGQHRDLTHAPRHVHGTDVVPSFCINGFLDIARRRRPWLWHLISEPTPPLPSIVISQPILAMDSNTCAALSVAGMAVPGLWPAKQIILPPLTQTNVVVVVV